MSYYSKIHLPFFFPATKSVPKQFANTSLLVCFFLLGQIRWCLSCSLSKNTEGKYCWEREGCTNPFPFSFICHTIGSLYALLCKTEPACKGKCPQDGTKGENQRKKILGKNRCSLWASDFSLFTEEYSSFGNERISLLCIIS